MNGSDRKRRILFVMDGSPAVFGGGKRVFLQIMAGLDPAEFSIASCVPYTSEQKRQLDGKGIVSLDVDIQNGGFLRSMRRLVRALKEGRYDIVHSQGPRADFFARVACRLAGTDARVINTIAMLVDGYDVGRCRKLAYTILDRTTERYTTRFLVVSRALRNRLVSGRSIPPERVQVIHNGIEIDEYKPPASASAKRDAAALLGLRAGAPTIGLVGRLVWQKGASYAIGAMKTVLEHHADAQLAIVGDGPLRKELVESAARVGVERSVVFCGFRADIGAVMPAFDVVVVPSLLEGFPMVTLEAMAMAKPVVATGIDGIDEQIEDGVSGILVAPRDPAALASAVCNVLGNPELAVRLGTAARQRVQHEFDVRMTVRATIDVYADVLRMSGRGGGSGR